MIHNLHCVLHFLAMALTIHCLTRTFPTLPYEEMLYAILGKSYNLSLVFVGAVRAQKLNHTYRNASYIPNILSFPLSPTDGEIFITPRVAYRESKKFDMSPDGYIGYLFIHGLLHLKGYTHSDTMDRMEKKYVALFKLT